MGEMTEKNRQAALRVDREDLLAVLSMRFGAVPEDIQTRIATTTELDTLERLILVAANTPDWKSFVEELDAGSRAFRLVGQRYDPLSSSTAPHASDLTGASSKDKEPR